MANVIPKFVKGEIIAGWVAEDLWVMLLGNTHNPLPTQQYISDIIAHEITDSGGIYVQGGVQLTNKVVDYDPVLTNNAFLDALNISIGPGANLNYRYGVVYKKGGAPASSAIRAQIDFLADQIVVNGTSVIQWNSLGIIYIA